ncbi:MAG TPA: biotin carboxylase N-terminal domain-containing protein [Candidatus Limnocylindrales bacterium]|nr:biotin carboxylase N-terminal domain-containing protein [Candidatus Limnocylindrales bacterium]
MRKDRPFERVLVANRGEIAIRIFRACRELGVATVAVYSEADSAAAHVRAADEAVLLGPAAPAQSYLRVEAVVEAALRTGSDAVHPGYGFLSEQPALAEACAAADIAFVGPSPLTLALLGNKLAARAAAAEAAVPVVPGLLEPVPIPGRNDEASVRSLAAAADSVGYPLLVKAAAGGGGRGMRRVDGEADLLDAVAAATKEAGAAFGDGTVYLERYVERARHVEVQLLGDASGRIVALGERDCSTQRRHQKLVEEAPAPGLTSDQRRQLHRLAVGVASTVGLVNAATAEFLLTPDGDFWFLEVNARLQVEHGVTELVSGLDLVHEQLWLAAGRPLSDRAGEAAARAAEPTSHAIEVRLSAEDPARDFIPTPGTITRWAEPSGPGVRMDSGYGAGDQVSTFYDPLLAKLMVHAGDRETCLARLRRALDELSVTGVQTTLPFHRWLAALPGFADTTELSTDLVARLWQPGALVQSAGRRAAELGAGAWRSFPSAGPSAGQSAAKGAATSSASWWREGLRELMDDRGKAGEA